MTARSVQGKRAAAANAAHHESKETWIEQVASFVGFFIYLLVLKSFFLPLFIIPTGSMAETLYGAHSVHTCPNCGVEYPFGLLGEQLEPPEALQCPNCRWTERVHGHNVPERMIDDRFHEEIHKRAGDRIMVHGWTYDLGGPFAPKRWDVVVFKVPSDGQTNYIKRLIGKPGETIEIIDGDVFVTDPKTGQTEIARKPANAQSSLWFRYYDQDYPPQKAASGGTYLPRWEVLEGPAGWSGLDTRRPQFDGTTHSAGTIQFATDPNTNSAPGRVTDVYGYDGVLPIEHYVTDVRLSTVVDINAAHDGGFVELGASKYLDRFYVRFHVAGANGGVGRITLEHSTDVNPQRETWAEYKVPSSLTGPHLFALAVVDYAVRVEIDGKTIDELQSTREQYDISADEARNRAEIQRTPRLTISADGADASFAHVLIERDVYYTTGVGSDRDQRAMYGTTGNPIRLGDNDYFVMGDNSPASLDSRFSFSQEGPMRAVGPHLWTKYAEGEYQLGTVPGDQLIGPAFLVYWPGTDAILPDRYLPQVLRLLNQLPGPGRIRWIH